MKKKSKGFFENFAIKVTRATGHPMAFILAVFIVIIWGITGPLFGFSDTWQLVINTGTTIITFLMVFVIQHSQNKDTVAIHLKLNELIAANKDASNRLIDAEDLTDKELDIIKRFYIRLGKLSEQEKGLHITHSLDEAKKNETSKSRK